MKKLLTILALSLTTLSFSSAQCNISGGCTGWATSTKGDLLVGTTSKIRYTRLPIGSTGQVLWVSGGQPAWIATSSLGIISSVASSTIWNTLSATYPIQFNSSTGVFSSGFSTSTINVFSSLNTFNGGVILNNATATNFSWTNATGTNAGITNINGTSLSYTNSTSTNIGTTNLTVTNSTTTNSRITSLSLVNGTGTNLSLINLNVDGLLKDSANTSGTLGQVLSSTGTSTRWVATSTLFSTFGTVTSVSVVTANGVSGSVATANTTPAITLTLGAITPTSVQASTFINASTTLGVSGRTDHYGNVILASGIKLGVATDTPITSIAVATGSIFVAERNITPTSTAMTIPVITGNKFLILYGTQNIVVTFTGATAGATWGLTTCAPPSGTPGTVFFATGTPGITWSGGTLPASTATAKKCDHWSFWATAGTSSSATAPQIDGSQNANF